MTTNAKLRVLTHHSCQNTLFAVIKVHNLSQFSSHHGWVSWKMYKQHANGQEGGWLVGWWMDGFFILMDFHEFQSFEVGMNLKLQFTEERKMKFSA